MPDLCEIVKNALHPYVLLSLSFSLSATEMNREVRQDLTSRLQVDVASMKKWFGSDGDPGETAWAILRSTALGEAELYYPPWQPIRLAVIARHLFPGLVESATKTFSSQTVRKAPGADR